ncbi:MAG: twin-arginine translocase TatA/TatE family subunit [Chloroflexi bacterium]|nr:twin-arginine translocase TatA/TatE family subunit [Chloroflexota bacterium]
MPIGPTELIIILVLVLIIFGAGKLPELGSGIGKAMKEFRKTQAEIGELKDSLSSDLTLEPKQPKPTEKS